MSNKTFATFDHAQLGPSLALKDANTVLAAALFADLGRRMGAHHSRHQRMRLHRRLYENT